MDVQVGKHPARDLRQPDILDDHRIDTCGVEALQFLHRVWQLVREDQDV